MLERTRQEVPDAAPSRAIVVLITTILVYNTQLNRRQILEEMLQRIFNLPLSPSQ